MNHGEDWCISFGSLRVDEAVAKSIVNIVQPQAIEAARTAAELTATKGRDRQQALQLELEQARYEADLAARRYEAVDPANRLVVDELEARWERTLRRAEELQRRLEALASQSKATASPNLEELRALASDLVAVWNSTSSDMSLKQRIARTLIREIIADVDKEASEIVLVIHWEGGRHSELRVRKNKSGEHRRRTKEEAADIIRRMAGRWPHEQIAATLNRLGLKTGAGNNWNESRVYSVRHRMRLPAFDSSAHKRDDILTLDEVSRRLKVSSSFVRKLIRQGVLTARQVAPGAPWEISAQALEDENVKQESTRMRQRSAHSRRQAKDRLTLPLPGVEP